TRAEEYLAGNRAWHIELPDPRPVQVARRDMAELRKAVSAEAGRPMIVARCSDDQALTFAQRAAIATIARHGPATPDHVSRPKRLQLTGRDLQSFREEYEAYFAQNAPHSDQPLTMLDPAPRVILDPELGLCTIGRTARDSAIVEDIYRHTIDIILRATALGGY